jgi:hypothetical protein
MPSQVAMPLSCAIMLCHHSVSMHSVNMVIMAIHVAHVAHVCANPVRANEAMAPQKYSPKYSPKSSPRDSPGAGKFQASLLQPKQMIYKRFSL